MGGGGDLQQKVISDFSRKVSLWVTLIYLPAFRSRSQFPAEGKAFLFTFSLTMFPVNALQRIYTVVNMWSPSFPPASICLPRSNDHDRLVYMSGHTQAFGCEYRKEFVLVVLFIHYYIISHDNCKPTFADLVYSFIFLYIYTYECSW